MQESEYKIFNVRIPKESWIYLRKATVDMEISINAFVVNMLEKKIERMKKSVDRAYDMNI